MIFLLANSVFTSKKARDTDLISLFRAAALRGHSLFIVKDPENPKLADESSFQLWKGKFPLELGIQLDWLAERCGLISSNAATRGAKRIAVMEDPQALKKASCVAVNVNAAVRLAALPLSILLENALSDGAFIRRTMPAAWRRKFLQWEATGVIKFEHGGGIGEMKRLVENFAQRQDDDDSSINSSAAWKISHFLVSDRDSQNSTGKLSREAGDLSRACESAGITRQLHILERRDQESYLPKEALDAIASGMTGADRDKLLAAIAAHFQKGKERHHLPLPALGKKSPFKNAFLSFETKISWDDNWFTADGSAREMVDLAESVSALL